MPITVFVAGNLAIVPTEIVSPLEHDDSATGKYNYIFFIIFW
jgi:hypothetical protein